jgi:hypothetical protein
MVTTAFKRLIYLHILIPCLQTSLLSVTVKALNVNIKPISQAGETYCISTFGASENSASLRPLMF